MILQERGKKEKMCLMFPCLFNGLWITAQHRGPSRRWGSSSRETPPVQPLCSTLPSCWGTVPTGATPALALLALQHIYDTCSWPWAAAAVPQTLRIGFLVSLKLCMKLHIKWYITVWYNSQNPMISTILFTSGLSLARTHTQTAGGGTQSRLPLPHGGLPIE